jgi:glycosyltransferase involved in cell wall biosynthesis
LRNFAARDEITTLPKLSVIVATRNRRKLLERTLAHLVAQHPPHRGWELILVDSSPLPLTNVDAPPSIEVRVVSEVDRQPIPRSAAAARNLGARLASAERLCFVDDDMLVAPGFLRRHVDRSTDNGHVLLGYRYLARPSTVLPTPGASFAVADDWLADERESFLRRTGDQADWACLYAHSFSLERHAFEAVGGFDESFSGCGGEDVELGYRLHRAGMKFGIARDTVALHQYHPRSPQRWRDNAANLDRLVARHPELAGFASEVRGGWRAPPEFHAALAEGSC